MTAEHQRRYRAANLEKVRESERQYRTVNQEKRREAGRRYHARLRDQVFDHYGRICACPGCGAAGRLTIDHIDGNGRVHREELFGRSRENGSRRLYRWLVSNGFPPGFQVLCAPCNSSKRHAPACRLDHAAVQP